MAPPPPTPATPPAHAFPLPPEDRALSPFTGLTRAHWEAVADGLLAAVRPYATPGQALILLPGARPSVSGPRSDGLEGYARTFLLAAFRVAGAQGDDPHGLLDRYADGLAAGTAHPVTATDRAPTAAHPEAWPAVTDRGQAMVEAASVALGLRLTRPWLWDRLDDRVRERAAAWLSGALRHAPCDNNWWLFPLTVGGFLAEAEAEAETGAAGTPALDATGTPVLDTDTGAARRAVDRGLERIERWWRGDGWYTDGRPRAFDHYNGWALHFYPPLHAHLAGDQRLLARYGPRLAGQLRAAALLFGADGAPVHQGRSLTYRFATAAAPWLGALTGHTPLAPGTTRRLASGVLRHFLDRGAAAPHGLLNLGWYGPYEPVVQPYSGPASPYWASKGFLGLLMPPDHPVWTAVEEPLPAERGDAVTPLPAPGWLIQSTAADGLVRLHNHGSDNQPGDRVRPDDPLYARLAYSTRTGPTLPGAPPDNHFGLVIGGEPSERGRIEPMGTGDAWAASAHRPRVAGGALPGVRIVSVTLAHGPDEVRAHLVVGAAPGTPVRQSGWAADPSAGARSELVSVHGFGADAQAVRSAACATAYGPHARSPMLTGTVPGAEPCLFAAVARLTGVPGTPGTEPCPEVTVAAVAPDAFAVAVRWPDGARHAVTVSGTSVRDRDS
ncbi:DUF2264 domain-containing protein [Streptomyces sp. XD-27]|uniref:DUF2264 domain-containing protein n=1 Tax=Streptomyces sp. XD-27 TaxID=3062779 RepID=UPI0026F46D60|nr:DUF2264 domain-containing protein [Streptomyces sp. XD-27]WKX68921.1 DUF2264 domain-containing protein [Streptomyces sp. XD-27]